MPAQGADELVTVIIPARNEEASIGATLDSVLDQTYQNLQVVVVDGESTDRTRDIIADRQALDPRLELITNSVANIPMSLNLAVAAARGEWLVRVDAHSTVPSTYVESLVKLLREGSWGGVGGRKDGVGHVPAGRAIAAALGSRFGVGNSKYHYATQTEEVDHLPFGAYPVALIREVGGWDERLAANEDYEFDYRLRLRGERLLLDPRIVISWECRQSLPDLFRQYVRYGRGKADVAVLHPSSLAARHVVAPALVAWLGLAAIVALKRPGVAAAMAAPYGVALAVASAQTGAELDDKAKTYLPGAFAAMHLGWGYGFWAGLGSALAGRRSAEPGARAPVPGDDALASSVRVQS